MLRVAVALQQDARDVLVRLHALGDPEPKLDAI